MGRRLSIHFSINWGKYWLLLMESHWTLLSILVLLFLQRGKMGRSPSFADVGLIRGAWSMQEDEVLINYIRVHGEGNWKSLAQKSGKILIDIIKTIDLHKYYCLSDLHQLWICFVFEGLKRCGKSCRLRWLNYLRPGIKRGSFSPDEEELIIKLHRLLGNRYWGLALSSTFSKIGKI